RALRATPAEHARGIALAAALHAALARQQQDVVVVEDFHGEPDSTPAFTRSGSPGRAARRPRARVRRGSRPSRPPRDVRAWRWAARAPHAGARRRARSERAPRPAAHTACA